MLLWLALCWFARAVFIDGDPAGACALNTNNRTCLVRATIGSWIYLQVFGKAALLLAALTWMPRLPLRAAACCVAALSACLALAFFNAEGGSIALVVALLSLAQHWQGSRAGTPVIEQAGRQ